MRNVVIAGVLAFVLAAAAAEVSSAATKPPPPVITITAPTATSYVKGAAVAASYACAPATSCTGTVANGSPINTGTLGRKTFTVRAVNQIGARSTSASLSVSYTVVNAPPPPPTPPVNQTAPSIQGTPRVGSTLTVTPGTYTGTAPIMLSYVWSDGTVGNFDTLKTGQEGSYISVTEKAMNSAGTIFTPSASVGPVAAAPPCQGYVALSFDDGPTAMTQQYLDALSAGGARATFFLIGVNMQTYPATAAAEVAAGNDIGDHTWDHQSFTGQSTGAKPLTDAQITQEIQSQADLAKSQTGITEDLLRPPYGDMFSSTFDFVTSLGYTDVMWTYDTNDWKDPSTSAIVSGVLANVHDQSVVLMHDGHPNTLAAIPGILSGLRSMGLCPGKIVPDPTNADHQFDYNGLPMDLKVTAWPNS
jgi:peptidoglycan/xylan/chitin deacetylase (PgdA/CDA1 family)